MKGALSRSTATTALIALIAALLFSAGAQARLKFPPAQTLSEGGSPQVAVDSQDRATIAFQQSGIRSVRLGADGAPEGVKDLASNGMDTFLPPQLAVDPQGHATVVWELDTTIGSDSDCFVATAPTCVQAIRLDAAATLGPVRTLSRFDTPERDPDLGGLGSRPQVAVDPQGRATVVWRRVEFTASGADSSIESARIDADGAVADVQTLSEPGAAEPEVAVDPLGRATVVWSRFDGTAQRIETVRLGDDGVPGAVETLSKRRQDTETPQVAVDPRGRATVVWRRADRAKRRIQSVRLGAEGDAGKVKTLSKGADSPQVAVDDRGRATVVWRRIKKTKRALVLRVQSVRLGTGGGSKPKTLSKARAFDPRVAVDDRGRATVIWERLILGSRPAISRIEARRLRADGDFGRVRTLAKGEGVVSPQVAVDSMGRPTVVWGVSDLSVGALIQATRGTIGG